MRHARIVVALGLAQTLVWGASYYLPATLAAPMAADLGTTPATVFAAFSGALVVSALLGPYAGRLIDRLGGRGILVASDLLVAAGLVAMALAQGVPALFAAWILVGIGMSCGLYEAAFSTLAGIFGRNARGPITGITLIGGFASTVSWPATSLFEAEFGWRVACLAWAAVLVAVAVPLNLSLPRRSDPASPRSEDTALPAARTGAGPVLPIALLAFVFGTTWFVSTAMAAHLPGLLVAAGAAPAAAVAAAALVGPAQVAARLLEFSLMGRTRPIVSARIATLAHPLGAGILLAAGPATAPVFASLHGAGNGVMTIASGTLPLALFGPDGYGLRQGLIAAPARFAAVFAPLVFAVLIERFGVGALAFSSALGLASFAALLVLGVATRHRPTAGP